MVLREKINPEEITEENNQLKRSVSGLESFFSSTGDLESDKKNSLYIASNVSMKNINELFNKTAIFDDNSLKFLLESLIQVSEYKYNF